MSDVMLITPTGCRPEAFHLCETWITRQTWKDFDWVVVDDGVIPTPMTCGQAYIRPAWRWHVGENTQAACMRLLLEVVLDSKPKWVFVIEDDEWYSSRYLAVMLESLQTKPIVGEGKARYYILPKKQYYVHSNTKHACLARTAFSLQYAERLYEFCKPSFSTFDKPFWAQYITEGHVLFEQLSVGVKGMPGRGCITGVQSGRSAYLADPTGVVLQSWFGYDADLYLPYWGE